MKNYLNGEDRKVSKFGQKRSHIVPSVNANQGKAFDLRVNSREFQRGDSVAPYQRQFLEHGALKKHSIEHARGNPNTTKMQSPERAETPKIRWNVELAAGQFQNG